MFVPKDGPWSYGKPKWEFRDWSKRQQRKKEREKNQKPTGSYKAGCVYVITNPAWPGWVKIGQTITPKLRVSGFQTSSPFRDYTLNYYVKGVDRHSLEEQVHKTAEEFAEERRGEWFKISIEKAKQILDDEKERNDKWPGF